MKQTTEQLKAVRDNAPEGATHVDIACEESIYYTSNAYGFICCKFKAPVLSEDLLNIKSLSDIREIVELREQIEAMHKAWNKNQAKDQDLLHECSNENEKLREKLAQAQSELTKFIQNTEKELRKGAEAL